MDEQSGKSEQEESDWRRTKWVGNGGTGIMIIVTKR